MTALFKPARAVRAARTNKRARLAGAAEGESEPLAQHWRRRFFAALADTSNVSESCTIAGVGKATVYDLRRRDQAFAAKWIEALCEGYDNLEMETVYRLRRGDPGDSKYNYAAAIRLLTRHRETVTLERARRASVSIEQVRASLDRKVAEMRALVVAQEETRPDADEAAD